MKFSKEQLLSAQSRFRDFVELEYNSNLDNYPNAERFLEACMRSFIERDFPKSGCLNINLDEYHTLINKIQKGIDGVLWHISARIVSHLENIGFTKQQINKAYYVIYSSIDLGMKPIPELITDEARSNTN